MLLYQEGDISLIVSRSVSVETIQLLQQTQYGTSGIRYQHTGLEEKIRELVNPYFFEVKLSGKVVGTYCLSQREVVWNGKLAWSFYGRYLSVAEGYGGKGYGSLLKREAVKYIESKFGREPKVFFSFIEDHNERSMLISRKEGFVSAAQLSVLLFSRVSPRKRLTVARVQRDEIDSIKSLLAQHYHGFQLFHTHHIGYHDQYFVTRDAGGQVLLGVQANLVCWKISHVPGWSGKIIMKMLPHVPIFNRLFNPAKYEFLALEGLYVRGGQEHLLVSFLESVLAEMNLNSALFLNDSRSKWLPIVKKKAGILEKLNAKIVSHVMIKCDLPASEDSSLFYASSFDFM